MSAITGIFLRNGDQVDYKSIQKMNDRLSHRGPDGSGVFVDGPVALGQQMLHTTPESLNEKLPFEDESSGLVITADARIDNRDELAPLLGLENSVKEPDSLVILKAYQKWGEKCPEKLLGDFAFAIWDPAKEVLFCARDHMGLKPFFYYLSDDAFYFATEIKAILTLFDVPNKINKLKVAFYLINSRKWDNEFTFYEDIFRLLGANSIKIEDQIHHINKYWELDPDLRIKMDSEEEYINAFREIFREAVNCRLRSAFPVGVRLSGGLDSTSVVCMAKKILNEKDPHFTHIETYSYVTDDVPQINERHYIEKTVGTGQIQPTYIDVSKISPFEEINTVFQYQDQPFFTPQMSMMRTLNKKINENKIRICLDGEGGDHISAIGPSYFKELLLLFRWGVMIKEITGLSKRTNQKFLNIILNQVFLFFPNKMREIILNIWGNNNYDYVSNHILNKDFIKKLNGKNDFKNLKNRPSEGTETTRKYHYNALTRTSVTSIYETINVADAEFSLERRSPFFDKRLVEFCYAVPNEIKFKNGWNRYLHRAAMNGIIPEEIRCQPFKQGLPPISRRNLLFFGKDYLDEIISIDNKILGEYVDLDVISEIYQKYKLGSRGNEVLFLWFCANLYFWLQKIDNRK